MHLHATTPSVAAEVPGVAQAQLDVLARSVEARRVQLEADIDAYIARKQDELRQYETELVETLRAMGRDDDDDRDAASSPSPAASRRSSAASTDSRDSPAQSQPQPQPQPQSQSQSQSQSQPQSQPQPDEQKKAKKHGRVHKREKELYGLVTPVFLPLLDARESTSSSSPSPSPEKKPAPASPAPQHAASAPPHPQHDDDDMPADAPAKERANSDPVKKRRSSIKKKSALRHSSAPRNRKRVSLVIDDQVVLPSDMITEPALTSPGSESTSATASTASLDDMIDPRLTADGPVFIEHTSAVHHHHADAVHHSLPLSSTAQPAKAFVPEASISPPTSPHATSPRVTSPHVTSPPLPYAPPSYATRSFLDPPPEAMHIEALPQLPITTPIYPPAASPTISPSDQGFQTYVGGLSGSGVDDVNQAGSVGYPSSLGASYLESYMQSRPLSVRMAAAEREGDTGELKKLRGLEERRRRRENDEKKKSKQDADEDEWSVPLAKSRDVDEDDFMGSMDDF